MTYYDVIVIGLGPAGMAVTAMGAALGLRVLAIEKNKVGGECLNCGCIPSKALLKAAQAYHDLGRLGSYGLDVQSTLQGMDPLLMVREKIATINGKKLMKVFEKATVIDGEARLDSPDSVRVNNRTYQGRRIFIATGTEPFLPPIPGLCEIPNVLTNTDMFEMEKIPQSLTIIGGGAIGTEMAQAFCRLGAKVNVVHMDPHLIPAADRDAADLIEKVLVDEGVTVRNSVAIKQVEYKNGTVVVTAGDEVFKSERLLVAAGRAPVVAELGLETAGVEYTKQGVVVDQHMRTTTKNIYAVGDCNGQSLFSHAAMHQGMLALMDSLSPFRLSRLRRDRYVVPWAVFTEPEVAQVGLTEAEGKAKGLSVVRKEFKSYGRMVADGHPKGFIKVVLGKLGRIYGATVVGEGASDLIQEWATVIQQRKGMVSVMMTQHTFPAVCVINKMVAEQWMMEKSSSPYVRGLIRFLLR
ncbi:MAG: pyridine nucleotide-disulfide oxidoreductase [Dethiosulfovibrio peptidovorans]|nr:MAG: pyridine nucleotide-disulfide oxidoreductase [Dethiosulfovibrio peptidovorans]